MLALYHLLRGKASVDQMEGAGQILDEAEVTELPTARFAVIVGTALNPSRTQKVNGLTTRTLWGNIAAQLGGQDGYEIVKTADKKSVAPRRKRSHHASQPIRSRHHPHRRISRVYPQHIRCQWLTRRFIRREPHLRAVLDRSSQKFRTESTRRFNSRIRHRNRRRGRASSTGSDSAHHWEA